MIIEYSNTIAPKNHSTMAMAIVITASALFFIPTTLIVLGYYSNQPTGSLISPLPQGTLSQKFPQTTTNTIPSPTTDAVNNQPIIAAPNDATKAASSDVAPISGSNIIDKVATISAGITQMSISDRDVSENSQIYLSPRPNDKTVYALLSKSNGSFSISISDASDIVRYLDYHIVNP